MRRLPSSETNMLIRLLVLLGAFGFVPQSQAKEPLVGTVITGSSAYSPETLYPVYRDSLGQQIDALGARAILANIESKYLQDGYLKPQLVLRDELLNEGILRVDIYEARLTDVQISGKAGPHQERLTRAKQRLLSEPVLRQTTIALALESLRALPGLSVVASTASDPSVPNAVILVLRVSYQPVSASLNWTNVGTSAIGPNFISASVTANSLLGGREQLNVLLVTATDYSNYHGAGLTFSTPLNDRGTTLSITAFRSASEPSFGGPPVELAFPHDVGSLQLTQSLLDTGRQSLRAYVGYDYDDALIRYEGTELESDRLRVAVAGAQFDGRIAELPYGATFCIRRGLNAFGAGVSAINGTSLASDYTVASGQTTLVVPWNAIFMSRLSLLGQWSGDVLPYDERFKIGNEILARAFKTAEFAGDDGIGVKAEMRARLQRLATQYGVPTLYGYSDYGEAWQHDLSIEQHAATAGLGLAWDSTHLSGSVEWAKPVTASTGAPNGWVTLGTVTLKF
jgi:hemolysin activation/secretion protein